MKAMILLGAPGAGKGTMAEKVKSHTKYIHVSTGDMLRAAVKGGTATGKEAEGYMKRGELVPDTLIMRLVEERILAGGEDDRYMFDGFPRTEAQAQMLEELFAKHKGGITHVFLLDAPKEVLLERLTGRRTCRKCAATFHVKNIPPKKAGVCDACGGELYQRPDDSEATILNRLDVYRKQTEGLISRYEAKGILVRMNSNQSAGPVADQMVRVLNAAG